MSILIAVKPTGRQWGNKIAERETSVTIGGIKCKVIESDIWEGGVPDEGIRQQYHRCTWLEYPAPRWDHS
jgi:hypothetical protein